MLVIPILVDGADMPSSDELPRPLAGLAYRNAVRLDHETFPSDIHRLLSAIRRALSMRGRQVDYPAIQRHSPQVVENQSVRQYPLLPVPLQSHAEASDFMANKDADVDTHGVPWRWRAVHVFGFFYHIAGRSEPWSSIAQLGV